MNESKEIVGRSIAERARDQSKKSTRRDDIEEEFLCLPRRVAGINDTDSVSRSHMVVSASLLESNTEIAPNIVTNKYSEDP